MAALTDDEKVELVNRLLRAALEDFAVEFDRGLDDWARTVCDQDDRQKLDTVNDLT